MPIRIVDRPEPLSEKSYVIDPTQSQDPLLIESDAARLLTSELRAYCGGEISGRSFLIAGHRGAGKTTLVANAFLDIWKESERGTGIRRPLLVLLNGPSLFPMQTPAEEESTDEEAAEGANKVKPPNPIKSDKDASGDADDEEETGPRKAKARPTKTEAQVALEQIILGLHRAVTREFSVRFRANAAEFNRRPGSARSDGPPPLARAGMAELSAQFDAELLECPEPSRLIDFYRLARRDDEGVLDRTSVNGPPFQSAAELLALSGICDAYKRISGDYMREDRLSDTITRELELQRAKDSTVKDVVKALVPLFIGGATGVGVAASAAGGLQAVGAGVLAALASAAAVKITTKRSTTRSRVENFIFDLSLATLDRVLPALIERLWNAGLAPVFVIDELDKIDDLPKRMKDIVHHLKKLVAENAFFCFLADREYFERMLRQSSQRAYPVEYTYYSHRLFVVFDARDFARYLDKRIPKPSTTQTQLPGAAQMTAEQASAGAAQVAAAAPESGDETDREILLWVLRHRSQLHPLDLRREITALRDSGGYVSLRTGEIRDRRAYLIDVTMQVLIEALLNEPDVRHKVADKYEYLRLVHDALYFITRRWFAGDERLEISETGQKVFEEYLKRRTGIGKPTVDAAAAGSQTVETNTGKKGKKTANVAEKKSTAAQEPSDDEAMSKYDSAFLFKLVARLAAALADEAVAAELILTWELAEQKARRDNPVPQTVRSAMLLKATECILVAKPGAVRGVGNRLGSTIYEWRYDPSGRERIVARKIVPPAEVAGPTPAAAPTEAAVPDVPPPPPAAPEQEVPEDEPTMSLALLAQANRSVRFLRTLNKTIAGAGAVESPLRYEALASQFHIIPTRPPWEIVEEAIKKLNRTLYSNRADIAKDMRLPDEFWDLIERNAENIARAVVCAAAVGLATGAKTRAERVQLGLEVVSRALRLGARSETEVQTLLRATTSQLVEIFGGKLEVYKEITKSASQWTTLDDYLLGFIGAVDEAVKLDDDRWQSLRTRAWDSAQKRVMSFLTQAPAHDPDVSEMFCSCRIEGPSLVAPFDFGTLTVAALTSSLVSAIESPQSSGQIKPKEIPAWAGLAAMHALGFGSFNPQHLTEAAHALASPYPPPLSEEIPKLFAQGLLARRRPPDITVIVIRRSSASLVGSWPVQSREYLFLAPTAAQAETLLESRLRLQYFFGEGQAVVAIEMEPDSGGLPVDIEVRDGVPVLPDKLAKYWNLRRAPVVYLYSQPPINKTAYEPALISPTRLEEIVSAAFRGKPSGRIGRQS